MGVIFGWGQWKSANQMNQAYHNVNGKPANCAEASLKFFSEILVELRRSQRILQRCLCKNTDSYMKANGIFGSTSGKAFRM